MDDPQMNESNENHSEVEKVSVKTIIKQSGVSSLFKFLIPSLIGIFLFMLPIPYKDGVTIPVAILSNFLLEKMGSALLIIAIILITTSAVGSIILKVIKFINKKWLEKVPLLVHLFDVTPIWFVLRIVGAVFVWLAYFKAGSEVIWSENTAGLVLEGLLPNLICVFLFAGFLLPLLLDFGLLEFVGAMLTKVMRPIFTLPGRSSIDCIASWLGDGSIGILLTAKQYEEGFYSKREAAVIGTTFSAVSITFSLVVLANVGLGHMFVPYYLTVTLAGVVAAIIIPRIPPLSKFPNTYYDGKESKNIEAIPAGYNSFSFGLQNALRKAKFNSHPLKFLIAGTKNVLDMWIGVLAVVMSMGGIALIISEYTPFFTYLGKPFIPLLKLLQVPEAAAASETMVVGFADMFIPSVMAAKFTNDMTKFIVAALSVTQLIYMSEVGGLLLGSKIPVKFWHLVVLFFERTLITLPVIVGMAHLLF